MSTRSRIALVQKDGTVKSIYCHFDGYPSHHKPLLEGYYKSYNDVEKLVNIGDISVLGKDYNEAISKKHWEYENNGNFKELVDFQQSKAKDMTIAYKDRGEKNIEAIVDDNLKTFLSKAGNSGEEFIYVFKEDYDGIYKWFYMEVPYLKRLSEAED